MYNSDFNLVEFDQIKNEYGNYKQANELKKVNLKGKLE
mgnify:CR=1 FL=1